MTQKIAIVGAGDLGQALAHYVEVIDAYEVSGFLDDTCLGEERGGIEVIGTIADARRLHAQGRFTGFVMGIGYNHLAVRQKLFQELSQIAEFVSLVHPSAYVDPSASIAPGAVIYPGCIIDAGSRVCENTLLNVGCTVAHDCVIGAHTFFGPAVHLAGFIDIGERCFLGIGTTIIDNITLADDTQTGGGTVVIHDLDAGLWVGNPARKVR